MTAPDRFDDLLDATGDDLAVEGAVDSLLDRLGVDADATFAVDVEPPAAAPPPPRRRPWLLALGSAAAALLVGALLMDRPAPPEPGVEAVPLRRVSMVPQPRIDTRPSAPSAAEPTPLPPAIAPAAPTRAEAALLVTELEPEPLQAPEPMLAAGLIPAPGSRLHVDGRAAVLSAGVVTFVRNGTLDPGVDVVALDALALTIVPVGATFVAGTAGDIAAVMVTDGNVSIRSNEDEVTGVAADEAVLVARSADGRMLWRSADGVPLTELVQWLTDEGTTDPHLAIDLVGQMRLARVPAVAMETVRSFE